MVEEKKIGYDCWKTSVEKKKEPVSFMCILTPAFKHLTYWLSATYIKIHDSSDILYLKETFHIIACFGKYGIFFFFILSNQTEE